MNDGATLVCIIIAYNTEVIPEAWTIWTPIEVQERSLEEHYFIINFSDFQGTERTTTI